MILPNIKEFIKEAEKFIRDPIGYKGGGESLYIGPKNFSLNWWVEPVHKFLSKKILNYRLHVIIHYGIPGYYFFHGIIYHKSMKEINRDLAVLKTWYKKYKRYDGY